MTRLIQTGEKNRKVRALFPADAALDVWHQLPNGFCGMLLENGAIDLRHAVKLTPESETKVWRIDRVTARGREKFIGYRPLSMVEAQLY